MIGADKMAMVKKKKKDASELPFAGRDIAEVVTEYLTLSDEIKKLTKRKDELSAGLKELAMKTGVKDNKGSFYAEAGNNIFGRVRSCTFSLNEDRAVDFFKERGLLKEVVKTVIDPDKIDALVSTGQLDADDIQSIYDVKETFKVYVTEKKEEESDELPEAVTGTTKKVR